MGTCPTTSNGWCAPLAVFYEDDGAGRGHHLSKSKLISGWQCGKRLWLEKYAPDEKEFSAGTEAAFAVGHQVGDAAQQQFPGGILIEHDQELSEALRETENLLAVRTNL